MPWLLRLTLRDKVCSRVCGVESGWPNERKRGALSVQQMIALIQEQAGQVRYMFSSECTHIVSNSTLSGKKNDDYLRVNSRKPKAKLVKPEWVVDSVENGKRLPEHPYAIRIDQVS